MSEYWVSTGKRYCDACKCHIGDNKASIQNHEGGKRHKENVTRRLEEIAKKGAKMHAEKTAYDKQMAKIESAALAAMAKDGHRLGDADRLRLEEGVSAYREKNAPTKSYYEAANAAVALSSSSASSLVEQAAKSASASGLTFRAPIVTPDETVGLAGGWVTVAVRDIEVPAPECPTEEIPLPTDPPPGAAGNKDGKRKKFSEKIVTLEGGWDDDQEDPASNKATDGEITFKKKKRKGNCRQRTAEDD